MNRYTQLLPFIAGCGDTSQRASVQWQLDGYALPTDVLALAWADLLYSFTGDECPVFVLDGDPVKADVFSRTFRSISSDLSPHGSDRCTALFTKDSSSPGLIDQSMDRYILSLTVKRSTGMGSLQSLWGIGPVFLQQIGKQLKQFVQKQAVSYGLDVELLASDTPGLSISNASPRTLPGPQLLHELALGPSKVV